MTLSCFVVDDEQLSRQLVTDYIKMTNSLRLAGIESDPQKALDLLLKNEMQPDLIFLDIGMPGLTGLDIASYIQDKSMFVFTTAHRHYSQESYEFNAIDYLVKPFPYSRFLLAVEKARQRMNARGANSEPAAPFFFIKGNGKSDLIKLYKDDVLYVEGASGYITVKTVQKEYLTNAKLKGIEDILCPPGFFRVHKSYLINIEKIVSLSTTEVFLGGRHTIPIGETYREQFLQHIKRYRP